MMKLVLPLLLAPALLSAQGRAPDFSKPVWASPVEFTALYWVRELRDGRVIAPDPGEGAIRLLGADGRPLGTIGQRGGGPQEFQIPLHPLALPGDSTLINDRDQQRFLLIGPDAKPVGTIPWPAVPLGGDGLQDQVESDGRGNLYFPRSSFQPDQVSTPILRWNVASGRFDSVQVVGMARRVRSKLTIDGHEVIATRVVPYDEGDAWGVAPGGEVAVVKPREYQLEWRGTTGAIHRGAPIPYRPAPITAEERTALFGPQVTDLPIPATKPAVTRAGILVSPTGEVWVSRYPAPGEEKGRWDILDKDGKLLRSLNLPGRRVIIGFGRSLVYVVRYDEDDIQHLEAYR
jgi:hypothetical protein